MKILIYFLLLSLSSQAAQKKSSKIDIKSTSDMVFFSKEDSALSSIGKIKEFQGTIIHAAEVNQDLSSSDLYKFPDESAITISPELCSKYADKMFGPADKRVLKLQGSFQLFETPTGKACEFQLKDTYEKARMPYRYTIVGFVHGKLIALMWGLFENPSASDKEKLKNFWKTLK